MRVNIELETSQTLDDETEVFTEYETGILRKTMDGGIIITYFDDGVHNEILLDQDFTEVKVVRDFDEDNAFLYRENYHHALAYKTEAGIMDLEFHTKLVEIDCIHQDSLLHIHLKYSIFQFGHPVSDNEVRIKVAKM